MKLKKVSEDQFKSNTDSILAYAHKGAVLVTARGKRTLVLRDLADDDVADELLIKHPAFRASIRKARANRAAGKGIPLQDARRRLLR